MRYLFTILLIFAAVAHCSAGDKRNPLAENVFAQAYGEMSLTKLEKKMASDVPTRRLFVATALAERKEGAWPVLRRSLQSKDWRIRSTALMALDKLLPGVREKDKSSLAKYPGLINALLPCLSHSNNWIRCQSAALAARVGPLPDTMIAALVKLSGDRDSFVRTAAIAAVKDSQGVSVTAQMQAAVRVLAQPRTGFGDSRFAMDLFRRAKGAEKGSPEMQRALVAFLKDPGQGMWNNNLTQALTILAASNPDLDLVTTRYAEILTMPAYDQQAKMRQMLCEIVPKYGAEARRLLPAFHKAAAMEEERIKKKLTKKNDTLLLLKATIKKIEGLKN